MRPTDPLYGQQWHFGLLGDIETIWNEFNGNGVNVAVYDDGVQYIHPDLNGNYTGSLHFRYGGTTYDPDPILSSDAHGTAVAGIIAGEANNGIGGVGVAWGATLSGVNLLGDARIGNSASVTSAAFRHAANFDVMSNSWGYVAQYSSAVSLASVGSQGWRNVQDYNYVVDAGRGGLGTIIVQAAGNESSNANSSGINAARETISVAAADQNGNIFDYSNWGAGILITGPAASVTTDLTGSDGYNTSGGTAGNYTNTFGGTSAATPVVSGVVALMLDANGGLGWRDVQNILATSASLTGSAVGGSGTHEVGTWQFQENGTWNGGGHAYHMSYGFGMVNAYAAVRMAEIWHLFDNAQTSANEVSVSSSNTSTTNIADTSTTTVSTTVNSNLSIEHILVTVNITHSYASDLELILVAPDGTEFPLMLNEGGSFLMDSGFRWTFGVTGALGMNAQGTWTLRIVDEAVGDVGTISEFTLEFFGSTVTNNDVHHITEDFLLVGNLDPERGTAISDTNGGTDWLNMAAIAGNVTLNMNSLGQFLVDGAQWGFIQNGTVIENAVTGDGDDSIIGNFAANELHGMRGDDTIRGAGGNDDIYGGAGNDLLEGGDGADTIRGGDLFDTILGGNGNDLVFGGDGRDVVRLGAGNDVFTDNDQTGFFGSDAVYGEGGDDTINGGGGDDTLFGQAGNDRILGGVGNDSIDGGDLYDTIWGGDGNDTVAGGNGRDVVRLGNGNDVFNDNGQTGFFGSDAVYGEGGNDTINGGGGNDTLFGQSGSDSILGGVGDDSIDGGDFYDTLLGGSGNDTVSGGNGSDLIYLGNGNDVFHDNGQGGVHAADTVHGGFGHDVINGGGGNDVLFGNGNNDTITGGTGNDRLFGHDGFDVLNGGTGNDTLTGGNGHDTFVFNAGSGRDLVADFQNNVDVLRLDDALWGGGLTIAQVIANYASVSGSNTVLDFGGGNVITIAGLIDPNQLIDDIVII